MSDTARMEAALEEHRGLVISLARRYRFRGVEWEDLLQVARLGLLRALQGFDEGRGLAFSTYAVPVIVGQLRDYLRQSTPFKVSRSLRADAARIARAAEELGGSASLADCAARAGLSEEDAALALAAQSAPDSLCALTEQGEEPPSQEQGYERVLEHLCLRQGLGALKAEDARLIRLRYFHGLTQSQTARVLGKTQSAVCRAQRRILEELRQRLT